MLSIPHAGWDPMVFGKPLLRPDDALESPYIKVYEFVFLRTQALLPRMTKPKGSDTPRQHATEKAHKQYFNTCY